VELKQLRRFLAVVDLGSFAAAAPALGLTQQALGASIASLERELGLALLDRSPGGVTSPTAYGELLIQHARAMIASAERARAALVALKNAKGGSVTLGVGETFASEFIAEVVNRFHQERPDVDLVILEDYSEILLDRMLAGEIDFIAGADLARPADGLIRFPLYEARDVVIARASHPLAGRSRLSLQDLEPFTWMAPYSRPGDAEVIVQAFLKAGLNPPTRFLWTDALGVGSRLLLSGDYLFMTSPPLASGFLSFPDPPIVTLKTPQPTVTRRAGLIYTEAATLNPAAMHLMDEIKSLTHRRLGEIPYAIPLNRDRALSEVA
jgi:DNA-binding transcriptional LysR family regulator